MNLINYYWFKRVYQKLSDNYYVVSYSQTGEDQIIELFLLAKGITNFNYLDIGANHPTKLNNTYRFYEQGYSGVCIEPDPNLFKKLLRKRKRDICLNVGISGVKAESGKFFIMDNPVLNTFSQTEAQEIERNGQAKIVESIRVPLKTPEQIIDEYFEGKSPVFVNLDVEGLDEEILVNFPFHKYRPSLFCIETVHFTMDASSEKRTQIMDLMKANRYKIFADTYINTIFVDADKY